MEKKWLKEREEEREEVGERTAEEWKRRRTREKEFRDVEREKDVKQREEKQMEGCRSREGERCDGQGNEAEQERMFRDVEREEDPEVTWQEEKKNRELEGWKEKER